MQRVARRRARGMQRARRRSRWIRMHPDPACTLHPDVNVHTDVHEGQCQAPTKSSTQGPYKHQIQLVRVTCDRRNLGSEQVRSEQPQHLFLDCQAVHAVGRCHVGAGARRPVGLRLPRGPPIGVDKTGSKALPVKKPTGVGSKRSVARPMHRV